MAVNPVPMLSEGVAFATLSKHGKDKVIKEIGEEAARLFDVKKQAIIDALDFRKMVSVDRLDFYRGKTTQEWAQLKQTFPDEYANQIRDFYILERRIKAGQVRAGNAGTSAPSLGYEEGVV